VLLGIALSTLPLLRVSRATTQRRDAATGSLRIAEAMSDPIPELVG
jgi:hypothetical protein